MNKIGMVNVFKVHQHSQETDSMQGNNQITTKIRIMISAMKKEHASLKHNNKVGENAVGENHLLVFREDLTEVAMFQLRPNAI